MYVLVRSRVCKKGILRCTTIAYTGKSEIQIKSCLISPFAVAAAKKLTSPLALFTLEINEGFCSILKHNGIASSICGCRQCSYLWNYRQFNLYAPPLSIPCVVTNKYWVILINGTPGILIEISTHFKGNHVCHVYVRHSR